MCNIFRKFGVWCVGVKIYNFWSTVYSHSSGSGNGSQMSSKGVPNQSARIAYLSWKIKIRRDWYRSQNVREIAGQKWKCVLQYTDFMFDRSRKNQKVRVPEYTFSLLPLSLVHLGFCTNLVGFRFSSLNKLVERTANRRQWARVFRLGFIRYFQWISATVGVDPGSFGLLIWNRAFT